MSASLCCEGISRSSSSKMKMALGACLTTSLVLSACSEGSSIDSCTYLDAFEKEVALEEFTSSKGHSDALKMIAQDRIVFLGGYMDTGPITILLREYEQEMLPEIEEIAVEFGIDKIEKVYLTKKLNEIKSGDFLKSDDGVVNGSQVERECYNQHVLSYAVQFNRTMIDGLLKKR
jgi:hypothetical protein